jgi:hypothetical protein
MRASFILLPAAAAVLLTGCGGPSGPPPLKPGTPPFIWAAAESNFKAGNFNEVSRQLGNLTGKESEFQHRSQVWQMVVNAGLARGDMEFADVLDESAYATTDRRLEFRRLAGTARTGAHQATTRLLEVAHVYIDKVKDEEITLPFGYPDVTSGIPLDIARFKKGILPNSVEFERVRDLMQRRGVLLASLRSAGAGEELGKGKELLGAGGLKVQRAAFLANLAAEFHALSDLYGPKKMEQAGRIKLLCTFAQKALGEAPETPQTKKLKASIEATLKKLPKDTK